MPPPLAPLLAVLALAACVDPMPPLQPLPPLPPPAAGGSTAGGVTAQPSVEAVVVPAPAAPARLLPARPERTQRPEHIPPPDPPMPGGGDWPPSLRQLHGLERSPYLPQRSPIGLPDCPAPAVHCR